MYGYLKFYLGYGKLKIYFLQHFFLGIESTRIQFQGIYESNSHFFQGVFIFKNLVVHAPKWIKNGIAHYYIQQCNFMES